MNNKDYKNKIQNDISWMLENGHIVEAEDCINQFMKMFPDSIENYSLQAGLCLSKGSLEQARQHIKNGLDKDPSNLELLQNMYILAAMSTDGGEKALQTYTLFRMLGGRAADDLSGLLEIKFREPPKVLHGTFEVANQMHTLTNALKKKHVSASAVNYYQTYLNYDAKQDISFTECQTEQEAHRKAKDFAAKALCSYNIFHFHFGTTLTFDYSDLALYQELKKKTFMHYWGSEIRRFSIAHKYNPYVKVKVISEEGLLRETEKIARYIPNCIVPDHELYLYVKNIFPNVYFLPQALDLSKYTVKQKTRKSKPLLVHAPTNPEIKGTEYIMKAIAKLHNEFDFDFQLVQGLSHAEAKSIYQKADLIIDQLLCGSYGLLALESMAMGKPVVCWISEYMQEKYPKELPIIIANPNTIYDVLQKTLKNMDVLPEIGKKGRQYIETYHDADKIAEQLIGIYSNV